MAYDALVERNIAKPRAKVFAALCDFGGVKKVLPDAVKSCELAGAGVGSVRTIELAAGGRVTERLEVAHDQSVFVYSILENDALPLEHYCAVVILGDSANGGTSISYGSNWTPKGANEDELRGMLEGLYNAIIDGLVKIL